MARATEPPRAIFLGGHGVEYTEHAPSPALAPWVATTWRVRASRPFDLRILPDGCVDLIRGDVVGPFTGAVVARLAPGQESTGVRLRPGAFPALFGVPASELIDERVRVSELIPRPRPLSDLARDAPIPDPWAEAALDSRNLNALVRRTGYSERQLRRRLVRATGFGPKRLERIGRMQAVLAAGRGGSWARTAAEHGYFDEAHMVNDIRALSGATPSAMMGDRFLQDEARRAA